jgi:hypothetical protein
MEEQERLDILAMAAQHLKIRRKSGMYKGRLRFGSFPLVLPWGDIKAATVRVKEGCIKEIEIFYVDESMELIRPEPEVRANV